MSIKVWSIILQILGFVIFALAVSTLQFVSIVNTRGIEGRINKLLGIFGLDGSYDGTKKRENLIYWLTGLAALFGTAGLLLELCIE